MRKILGFFFIFLSIIIILYVIFSNTNVGTRTQTFSTYTFLTSTWEKYRDQFINKDGRVIDYSQKSVTTSEGQSYALLRSVWIGDKPSFDLVWQWTKTNLKRPNDHLFGWRWGKKSDNSYGFMMNSDINSASDADEDIALALILASRRWHDQGYLSDAKAILADLWLHDTALAAGKRYVIAGNWASNSQELVVNPSYFAPYEYRVFQSVDTSHDWNSIIKPGYEQLTIAGSTPLDKARAVGLPPDWIAVKKQTGEVTVATIPQFTTNYSLDAVRVPWRIALDYQWNNSKEAHDYLTNNFNALVTAFHQQQKIAGVYSHDGSVVQADESPTMYATSIGFFMATNPALAKQIYEQKIVRLYSNNTNSFNKNLPYYDQNWLWFGAALYNKQLTLFQ